MNRNRTECRSHGRLGLGLALMLAAGAAMAAPPVVKTVPWVASNALIPHDTWSGKSIRLKGTSDVQGGNIEYTWDFGDGSPVATGTVADRYAIEASHAYVGSVGQVYTATLTVKNTTSGESASQQYYVRVESKALPVEVNVAIDEGLWYLHKGMSRYSSGGNDYGYWTWTGYYSLTAANLLAFEVNGHLEGGSAANPYTETVQRAMHRAFDELTTFNPGVQPLGDPDANGNDIAVCVSQGNAYYQTGMYMDALIASGTKTAIAPTGPANVVGRQYVDIVQDMADFYSWGQCDDVNWGGWRYGDHSYPDNSVCQWAAIGLIPATRSWNCIVPGWVKSANRNWLDNSQNMGVGNFGYTGSTPEWIGPYAVTPSGMVQLAWQGIGRGHASAKWDLAETYMRDRFHSTSWTSYDYNVKDFYYGLFAFVKAMLLHDGNADGVADPVVMLQSSTAGVLPFDWYSAEKTAAANDVNNTDGVARTLVNDQDAAGWWWYHYVVSGEESAYNTAWAIVMLQRTLFEGGAPVAVAKASPNPAVAGQTISLDGSDSYHQDAAKTIATYEWDLNNDGTYDTAPSASPFSSVSFASVGTYYIRLRVTDSAGAPATATATLAIIVDTPPLAPTAVARGPYNFCPGLNWFLDGTGSTNPDEGQSEAHVPPYPGDTITTYEWDLNGNSVYDDAGVDATGAQPDVTAYFTGRGVGSYVIGLRVTDRTAASFPSSGLGDLSDVDSAVVHVRSGTDPECACVSNLAARGKPVSGVPTIQLTWTPKAGAHHYNIYRGTVNGGPYLKIGSTTSTYAMYSDAVGIVSGVTYYYVVREANVLDDERCQSNQTLGAVRTR